MGEAEKLFCVLKIWLVLFIFNQPREQICLSDE